MHPLKTSWILVKVGITRWKNRTIGQVLSSLGKKKDKKSARTATPRKRKVMGFFTFVAAIIFTFNSSAISLQFIENLSEAFGPADTESLSVAIGVMMSLIFVTLLSANLGNANQDLAKPEWHMEWFFTFPVPAWHLFLGKLIEYTFTNFISLFIFCPFVIVYFYFRGESAGLSVIFGLSSWLYFNSLLAACKLLIETALRKSCSRSTIKNIQALNTIIGTVLIMVVMGLAYYPTIPELFLSLVSKIAPWFLWSPFTVPVQWAQGYYFLTPGVMALFMVGIGTACLLLIHAVVQDGLIKSGGVYEGKRKKQKGSQKTKGQSAFFFRNIWGKELRLLFRDKNLLIQVFFIPLIAVGAQIFINPIVKQGVMSNFNHAATLAFATGAYCLLNSAMYVLSVEGRSLWILYTFPQSIEKMMQQKTLLWGVLALFYPSIILVFAIFNSPELNFSVFFNTLLVMLGVLIYAFIASGLGIIDSDPLDLDAQKKMNIKMTYIFMFLSSLYGYTIYNDDLWGKFAQMTLSALLAYALWQKVRDHSPFLLDPTQNPHPQISLSDGLIAVLSFFVVQGLVFLICQTVWNLPSNEALLISFTMAGFLVFLFSLLVFWRRKIPTFLQVLGLKDQKKGSLVRAIQTGLVCGGVAGGIGMLYLEFNEVSQPLNDWRLLLLMLLAAPLFEEFIFRGILFNGFRRSVSPTISIVGSAALFALIHPLFSVIPVFFLGIAAAWSFERNKLLYAPIVAHMTYNAMIVGYHWMA